MTKTSGYYDLRQASGEPACLVCRHVQQAEAYLLTALVEHLAGPDSCSPFTALRMACACPHLRRVLSRLPAGAGLENLVEAQLETWRCLRTELGEFIRKSDFNVKEQFGLGRDAWIRAIGAISGAPPARVKD